MNTRQIEYLKQLWATYRSDKIEADAWRELRNVRIWQTLDRKAYPGEGAFTRSELFPFSEVRWHAVAARYEIETEEDNATIWDGFIDAASKAAFYAAEAKEGSRRINETIEDLTGQGIACSEIARALGVSTSAITARRRKQSSNQTAGDKQ